MKIVKLICCILLLLSGSLVAQAGDIIVDSLGQSHYSPIGTPNPDPAGSNITITYTGTDDHSNIEWAMNNNAPGGTVLLNGHDFYLSTCVDALYFNGTLKGLGREFTTLHMMDGFGYSQMGHTLFGGKLPWAIAIWYDLINFHLGIERPYAGTADLTMSDFTLSAEGDSAEVWLEHGAPSRSLAGIFVIGVDRDFDLYDTPTDLNTHFERLEIRGIPNDNSDGVHRNMSNMFWPIYLNAFVGGHHDLEDVRFIQTGYWLMHQSHDVEIDISDVYADSCTAFYWDVSCLRFFANTQSAVHVSRFKSVNSGGIQVALGPFILGTHQPQEPSTYFFEYSDIERAPWTAWGGIELDDNFGAGKKSTFIISNNQISSDHHIDMYGPIYADAVDGLVMTNNKITGKGQSAIYLNPWSVWGYPGGSGGFLQGNNVESFTPTGGLLWGFLEGASYFLGPGTSNHTLIGSVKNKVVDYGTNNYITGVKEEDAPPLGQAVKDAMMEKRAAKEQMKETGR